MEEDASYGGSGTVEVRAEAPGDREAVHKVGEAAFGRSNEAALVDALRDAGVPLVSLVTVEDGGIVGHLLFSPVSVELPSMFYAFGLAPWRCSPPANGGPWAPG